MEQNSNCRGCLWALLIVLLCPSLLIFIPILFGMIMSFFGVSMGMFGISLGLLAILPALLGSIISPAWTTVLTISLLVAILLPLAFIVYAIIRILRGKGLPKWQTWLVVLLIWLFSLGGLVATGIKAVHEAGSIEQLGEQLSNQSQAWEYEWSYEENDMDEDMEEND